MASEADFSVVVAMIQITMSEIISVSPFVVDVYIGRVDLELDCRSARQSSSLEDAGAPARSLLGNGGDSAERASGEYDGE